MGVMGSPGIVFGLGLVERRIPLVSVSVNLTYIHIISPDFKVQSS